MDELGTKLALCGEGRRPWQGSMTRTVRTLCISSACRCEIGQSYDAGAGDVCILLSAKTTGG